MCRWDPNKYYYSGLVDLGAMTIKRYSVFSKAPGLQPHHQMT